MPMFDVLFSSLYMIYLCEVEVAMTLDLLLVVLVGLKKLLIAHSFFSVQMLAVSFSQAAASGM